jgi:hypothetical protein
MINQKDLEMEGLEDLDLFMSATVSVWQGNGRSRKTLEDWPNHCAHK